MIIINWNVVSANFHPNEPLLSHMRSRITELEPYLEDFPNDSVFLHIELARDLKTDVYTAELDLRLQKKVLSSRQSAKDVKQAFDSAIKDLFGQLVRTARKGGQNARFANEPMPAGTGPQNRADMAREQGQEVHAS